MPLKWRASMVKIAVVSRTWVIRWFKGNVIFFVFNCIFVTIVDSSFYELERKKTAVFSQWLSLQFCFPIDNGRYVKISKNVCLLTFILSQHRVLRKTKTLELANTFMKGQLEPKCRSNQLSWILLHVNCTILETIIKKEVHQFTIENICTQKFFWKKNISVKVWWNNFKEAKIVFWKLIIEFSVEV